MVKIKSNISKVPGNIFIHCANSTNIPENRTKINQIDITPSHNINKADVKE
ncbi:MAG: hypothetical protein ACK50E_05695 [Bacteroidota bacterium]